MLTTDIAMNEIVRHKQEVSNFTSSLHQINKLVV